MNHVLAKSRRQRVASRADRGDAAVPRRAGGPLRRRAGAHPGAGRRAAGARSARALPDRSRRRGHHRPARVPRGDADLPQRGRAAGRLGHRARRLRRARGAAAPVPPEADLHQPDASQSDRHHPVDPHPPRAAGAGRTLPGADRRGRHLSRAGADRPGAAAVALQARRRAHRRHPHQQLFEDARAGTPPWLDQRRPADHRAARA